MKRMSLFCFILLASIGPSSSAQLDQKSKAPDWGRASQAEKDAWVAAFKFKKSDINRAAVAGCLDQYAARPLFESNDLSGVTQMCGSIAALP
jgi:hypothetical protein